MSRQSNADAVGPMPTSVSQLTAEAVLGIDARRYLALVRAHTDELRVSPIGKLRVVPLDDMRALLARLATASSAPEAPDDAPSSVDEVLAALGHRRVA